MQVINILKQGSTHFGVAEMCRSCSPGSVNYTLGYLRSTTLWFFVRFHSFIMVFSKFHFL